MFLNHPGGMLANSQGVADPWKARAVIPTPEESQTLPPLLLKASLFPTRLMAARKQKTLANCLQPETVSDRKSPV
jgi:hypothetical protein